MRRVSEPTLKKHPTEFRELVRMHPPCAIHDKVAYDNALAIVEALTDVPELSDGQGEYLDTLAILIEAYEREHLPIDTSNVTPVGVLRHMMEAHGMTASDLGRLLGERSLGPKVLNGQRELSKAHVRKLADHFKVAADLFL
jgi:HTH-type transcriptional regulator/antitoxin HigA